MGKAFDIYQKPGTRVKTLSSVFREEYITPNPWPDGPLYKIDDTFRAVCLETDALRSIMEDTPELATEIILSLLIAVRIPETTRGYRVPLSLPGERIGFTGDMQYFFTRFYNKGPFLLFLGVNPIEALKTIIRVVDFATEKWMETGHEIEARNGGIDLLLEKGEKRFIGDKDVYHWYHGRTESSIITSALMAVEKWLYERIDNKESIDQYISLIFDKGRSLAFVGMLSEVGRYNPSLLVGILLPLLLVPDTYYLGNLYDLQGLQSFGTPVSLGESDWFRTAAREWDAMEHRNRSLSYIAAHLFHNHKKTQEALIEACGKWKKRIGEGGGRWAKYIQELIAYFNQENWMEKELPDGTRMLVFQSPNHLDPSPDQVEESNKQMVLVSRALECWRILDENTPLPKDKISGFLEQAKELCDFEPDDPDLKRNGSPANAICGTIAVLFILHREWLCNHPEEEAWCVKKLEEIIDQPPKWSLFDNPNALGNFTYEHFACEVVPILWSENQGDSNWSSKIAQLAMAKHYRAAGILMNRAYERRGVLGDKFWQLVNLMLDWAQKRDEVREAHFTSEEVDISKWKKETIRRFVKGEYSADILAWGENSIQPSKLRAYGNHSKYYGSNRGCRLLCHTRRLDSKQMLHSFASIFLPDQASDSEERSRFLKFWDQALISCLSLTKFYNEKGNEIPHDQTEVGLTFDYERWVLGQLAVVVAQLRPDERSERYWQPILSLGPRADDWVSHFLNDWISRGKLIADRDIFLQYWRKMIDFCISSKAYGGSRSPVSLHLPSLWLNLIGLPKYISSLWQDNDKDLIADMVEYFVIIAPRVLSSENGAIRLISWLSTPSSEAVRIPILEPIYGIADQAPWQWWRRQDLATSIGQYLIVLWNQHREALHNDPKLMLQFRGLLQTIADKHEPLALQLQAHIASH